MAIGASSDGCREVIGAAEGMKEDRESRETAREKARQTAEKLKEMKRSSAAKSSRMERSTKAISAFSDGQSALMLVCARLRHVAGTQ